MTLSTDKIDYALDPLTGDIPASGDLAMTSGIQGVIQGATIRLSMCAGEWFANLSQGVRYLERTDAGVTAQQALLGQPFDLGKTLREFRRNLLGDPSTGTAGVPGLVTLNTLTATVVDKTLTVIWQATTVFGDTPTNTLVVPIVGG